MEVFMPKHHISPDRVTVTIPEDVKDLFAWMKNYEPQFEARDATIAAYLLKLGAEAYYQKGLENIEPLDAGVVKALAEVGNVDLAQALAEPLNPPPNTSRLRRS